MIILELIILFLAIWFSGIYIHARFSSMISFIIYKVDEDKKATILSLSLLTLSVIFWTIYIVCF